MTSVDAAYVIANLHTAHERLAPMDRRMREMMPLTNEQHQLGRDGWSFVRAGTMRSALSRLGPLADWDAFAASWNDLRLDRYMADGGRYRFRRYGSYHVAPDGERHRDPHHPHYQSLEYNPVNGGQDRWFEPILPGIGSGPTMSATLSLCWALFSALSGADCHWHVEVHQFRVTAQLGELGRPAPEGVHRDGVNYVLVLLIKRQNILNGATAIHTPKGDLLGRFTLRDPLDAVLIDDTRVYHGVTPITPHNPTLPAYRDVLVVTFRLP